MLTDDDLLTLIVALKAYHLPLSRLRLAQFEQKSRKEFSPLSKILFEFKMIDEAGFEELARFDAKKERIRNLSSEEDRFWGDGMPKKIGKYKILGELGRGGRALVYRGEHDESGEQAAVKVLSPDYSFDFAELERFERESEALSRLEHPGVIKLYESGWVGSIPYYIMEIVQGDHLTSWVHKPRPIRDVAVVTAKAAEAVSYIHAQGIVHRDVKPDNILTLPQNGIRITDFGIALLDRYEVPEPKGTAVGTPIFMSPEQARGGVLVDKRADIYSLGTTLYELLTGAQPYDGETKQQIVQNVLKSRPKPIREIRKDLPEALEQIVEKAMARKPSHRYDDALEMAEDLFQWTHGWPLKHTKPLTFWQRLFS